MIAADTPKIVWVVGMGRSGSMWTFNIVRALVNSCDMTAVPDTAPVDENAKLREAQAALLDTDNRNVWVLKTHKLIPEKQFRRSVFIATRRDPRDILISQMRFAELDFSSALKAAVHYSRVADHYRKFSDRIRLELVYPDVVNNPEMVCSKIARFLGLNPTPESVRSMLQIYSKDRVRNLIDNLGAKENSEVQQAAGMKTVLRVDRNERLYDVHTGFQSGHVSDYCDGDWRRILSPAQSAETNAALGRWLVANGYEPA